MGCPVRVAVRVCRRRKEKMNALVCCVSGDNHSKDRVLTNGRVVWCGYHWQRHLLEIDRLARQYRERLTA